MRVPMLVLDSSALFSMEQLPQEEFCCPPGVVRELERYNDPRLALWGDLLRVSDCTEASVAKVREAASKTGDIGRLSPVDITVLALALDVGGTVLTDDYSIQNTARVMRIPYKAVGQNGITKVEKWNYRCTGCRKWFKEKSEECPICGSPMRAYRKRRSREDALAADEVAHAPGAEYPHAERRGPVRTEGERVRQLLVGYRRAQRLVEHLLPFPLVIRQGGAVPDRVVGGLGAYASADHGEGYPASVDGDDETRRIAHKHALFRIGAGNGPLTGDVLALELPRERQVVVADELVHVSREVALGEPGGEPDADVGLGILGDYPRVRSGSEAPEEHLHG